jgi:type I restriction enzyme, S subunit
VRVAVLRDFCEFVQGGRHKLSGKHFVASGYPAFGAGGLNGYLPEAEFARDGIVLSAIGARCGKCFLTKGEWSSLANTQVIFPDPEKADIRFLWYQLNDERRWPRHGLAQPFIRPSDVKAHQIYFPLLDEQRRIAAILDKADALRRKRKRTLELLRSLTQSIFLEMFGDPITNPKKLTKIALGDLIKVKSGNGLVAKDMAQNGSFPVYGGNGINGRHDEFMFEHPQLVIGRVGVYCGAVHLTKPNSWVTDNALYVSEYKRPVSQLYLKNALAEANLNQYAGRAAQPLISGSRIYPVEILLPSQEEQTRFEMAIMRLSQLENSFRAATELANITFSSLQSRAFSGQL